VNAPVYTSNVYIFYFIINFSLLHVGGVFTALHGMQTRSSDENSVSLSLRLSVKHVHCDKTEKRSVQIFTVY